MKIAVPVLGTRIAPRLCYAVDFLIVRAEDGKALDQQIMTVGQFPRINAFVDWIAQQGIKAVLCCGGNRQALAALETRGVEVIWGLTGEAEERVGAYLSGALNSEIQFGRLRPDGSPQGGIGRPGRGPGGRGRGGGGGGGGGGRGRGRRGGSGDALGADGARGGGTGGKRGKGRAGGRGGHRAGGGGGRG